MKLSQTWHTCRGAGALLAVVQVLFAVTAAAAQTKPNIIFILADDLGIPALSCYGGIYKTPQLDKMAAGGIRFEHCYSSPLCAPSRALCMSGRYGFRTRVVDNPHGGRLSPEREIIIPNVLKQAGYTTAVIGKWRQLGYLKSKADATNWGWDEFLVWGTGQTESADRYWQPDYLHNGKALRDVKIKYGPDLLHSYVVDFARRHKDQPFFIYYPMTLIHGSFMPTPDSRPGTKEREQLYRDMIAYMDKLVGKLMDELEKMGLAEKTLVLFAGDNGSVGPGTVHGRTVDGVKHELKEGGSLVPLIASWRGTTPAGKVLPDLIDFTDFYVTFAELAGAPLPMGHKLDGHSFAPRLLGKPANPRQWVYVQLANKWYTRDLGWKLYNDGRLFDMSDAPFSENFIAAGSESPAGKAARTKLEGVLGDLNPGQFKAEPKKEH